MSTTGHLWAIGFGDAGRADQVRDVITGLGRKMHDLNVLDIAAAVCYPDGSFALNGESFQIVTHSGGFSLAHFLAALALSAPPLSGAAVGALLGDAGVHTIAVGISDDFVRDVAGLIKPGTSVLFVLDECNNVDAVLHAILGLGGTVLKTNVDVERAKLIQSALAASALPVQPNGS